MIRNYLKIALRNLQKQKGFSFINIAGLAIGVACAIFILLWVQDELSYDGFHENKDNIYRVATIFKNQGNTFYGRQTSPPVSLYLKDNYPEIEKSTTCGSSWLTGNSRNVFQYKETSFYVDDLGLADNSFFDIFTFPFIKGDKKTALSNPNNIVLSASLAEKCFGSEEPINKTIEVDGRPFIVAGVMQDVPNNSHLQFSAVAPLTCVQNTNREFFLTKWDSYGFSTYVLLKDGVNVKALDKKIVNVIRDNDPNFGDTAAYLFLQPLSKIRLFNVDGTLGFMQYVYIFSTIALIVLLIACINYMNLATARSEKRAKEIGLRKVVGSGREQIMRQFFSESVLYAIISTLFAVLLVVIFLPQFNQLAGKEIQFNLFNPLFLAGVLGIILLTGTVAGSYPALYLSSIIPISVLNKAAGSGTKKSLFRKLLVVTQFSLSIGLIVCMLIVTKQVSYMRNAQVGFEKENVITLTVGKGIENIFDSFKHELLENPNIAAVSLKSSSPLRVGGTSGTIRWEGKSPDLKVAFCHPMVEHDYFKTLNMEIVEGRDFDKQIQSDLREGFILNEAAVEQGNIQNPVGKAITVNGGNGSIIGVVQNAQLSSLRFDVQPTVYHLSRTFREQFQTLFIKVRAGDKSSSYKNMAETISFIDKKWKKFMPNSPFEYRFLDSRIEAQYRAEMRISGILKTFTVLAVFLSCLGLFGLTSFMAEQRTREIGVRKVLGASIVGLVVMLSKEFTKWVLIANIVAWPVAYFLMQKWLQDFANRIDLNLYVFMIAGGLAFVIALLTVSWQAVRAAVANPVEALRYE